MQSEVIQLIGKSSWVVLVPPTTQNDAEGDTSETV